MGGYSLAVAVGLVVGGRLGDIVGRWAMFLAGATGFTVASALCGVASQVSADAHQASGLSTSPISAEGSTLMSQISVDS